MQKIVFLILMLGVATKTFSQDSVGFFIKPELRTRMELRDGFQKLAPQNNNPAFFISQRSRMSVGFEIPKIKIVFTPQDVRVWGDEEHGTTAGIIGNDASFDMFEGYADISVFNNHRISIGRQTLSYDNMWLLSDKNWSQSAIASDAVVLKLKYDNLSIHTAASWNTLKENSSNNYYPTNRYKTLNFLWLNRSFSKSKLSLLHITTGQTETDTTNKINFKHTTGLYYNLNTENFLIHSNAYYQYGKTQVAKEVGAYMFYINIMYKFFNFEIGPEFTYFSGNTTVGEQQTTDKNFDLIYTASHRYLGQIDYFTNLRSHTKQGGLIHNALNINYNVNKHLSLQNSTHIFNLSKINSSTPQDKYLGVENDLIVKYKVNQWINIEGGYMFYIPTTALQTIQNVPNSKFSSFAYLQLTIRPDKIYLKK